MTTAQSLNQLPNKEAKRLSVRTSTKDNEEENPMGIKKLLTRLNTKTSNQKRTSNVSIMNQNSQNQAQSKQDKDELLEIPSKQDQKSQKGNDKKKKRKISLRRQITLVKSNTILSNEESKGVRYSVNIESPGLGSNKIVQRDSLKVIKKDVLNKKHMSTVMQVHELPQLGGKSKQKQVSNFFTSQNEQKIDEENQSIISEDDDDEEYMNQFADLDDPLKELIDSLEIRFQSKGEYMFRKGQKADYAYVVLYGNVIFLQVKQQSYLKGSEPQSPPPVKSSNPVTNTMQNALKKQVADQKQRTIEQELTFPKRTRIVNGPYIMIEEEEKVWEVAEGAIIGEIAMMDPLKATRALSGMNLICSIMIGMAKTDCVFLLLNHDAFDILVKEKQKKINEAMTQFLFEAVPRMKDLFQFKKVQKNVHNEQRKKEIFKEGDVSDKIFILKTGQCALYKVIEFKDELGITKQKQEKLMNIEPGAMFGENALFFNNNNQYSIRTITPATFFTITHVEFKREFKRLQPSLCEFFKQRNEFIQEREQYIRNARKHEKKNFNSKIEQGDMNIFLQKDFKTQVNFADNQTKKKLQVFFLRKELQQLNKAKKELDLEQELTRNRLNMTRKKGLSLNNWTSDNEIYEKVKVMYSPQKALKDEFGQIRSHEFFKTLHLKSSTSKQTFIEGIKTDMQQSILSKNGQFETPRGVDQNQLNLRELMQMNIKRNRNSNFSLYKAVKGECRTQSQASLQNYTSGLCNNRIYKSIHIESQTKNPIPILKSSQSMAQLVVSPTLSDQKGSSDKFFEKRKQRQGSNSQPRLF
ncbi:UNKNOWN [Stylonychia lemnae]|uniref:Cyclic nucleotide-binding domain-containing protein n=1 Tax=Stylonychia lemnae TaxID=5949 RepID=A0A078AJX8_STYLE|nr:UNKNOWN [Stylonychia lemnae]|eukprot:CDW82196.1 UNKNOWN [Stylonychia lemnae]